jgi:hypothetical protein
MYRRRAENEDSNIFGVKNLILNRKVNIDINTCVLLQKVKTCLNIPLFLATVER